MRGDLVSSSWSKYLGYTDGQMDTSLSMVPSGVFDSATVKYGRSAGRFWLACVGSGVVWCRVMPAALVPRPWDFVDPPIAVKPGRGMTPGPATQEILTQAVAPAGAPEPLASGTGGTEAIAEIDGDEDAGAFTEVRDGEALDARGDEDDELEDQREDDRGSRAEVATTPIAETPVTVPRHEANPDTKDS